MTDPCLPPSSPSSSPTIYDAGICAISDVAMIVAIIIIMKRYVVIAAMAMTLSDRNGG